MRDKRTPKDVCGEAKYGRAVKQKVWNEAENHGERDWGETVFFLPRLARVRLSTPRFTDFFTDL